jgi:branched-chain amino acid transport system substrate-binding protein
MVLGGGHQAIQDTAIGRTKYDAGKKMVMLEDIMRFPAECVNPPANMKGEDWIKAGFPGAMPLTPPEAPSAPSPRGASADA